MKKILLLGLDGATFKLMDPWIEEGYLPNISQLITKGTRGILQSTFLPITATAWPSMLTGKNPGKHGIYDFRYRRPGSYQLYPSQSQGMHGNPLHLYLSQQSKRVAMINVPMTYPPTAVNGILITDFTTPEEADVWCYPPNLKEELKVAGVPYPMAQLHGLLRMEKQRRADREIEKFIDDWEIFIEAQVKTIRYLLNNDEYDFFMLVFSNTDHINHHTPDPIHIRRIYEQVDKAIGQLLELVDEDTTILITSDHGSAPLKKFIVLNHLLSDMGLLYFRNEIAPEFIKLGAGRTLWQYREQATKIWNKLPAELRRLISYPVLLKDSRLKFQYQNIDWQKTKAFADSGAGTIFINLKGREPMGIVNPGKEYETLRDRIIEQLKSLRDPETNELVIGEVKKGEELFEGPFPPPDILFSRRDPAYRAITGFPTDELIRPSIRKDGRSVEYGYHTHEGIFIAYGPNIKSNREIKGADIKDIAPTTLQLLGLPIPKSIDGQVLTEIFENKPEISFIEDPETEIPTHPIDLSSTETEDIEERLRALGYLE